jgi:hypothetical protein
LEDCARAQRAKRLAADAESVDFAAAWREAEQELRNFGIATAEGEGIPAGHHSDDWGRVFKIVAPKPRTPELEIKPRVLSQEHREKVAQMSWGELRACTNADCSWGTHVDGTNRSKKHSDGSKFAPECIVEENVDDNESVEEVAELTVVNDRVVEIRQQAVAGNDVETSLSNDEFFSEESENSEPEAESEDGADDDAE